jgi:hypothetical protein
VSEGKRAANPINPRGVPRGIAKKDVYRELSRLDQDGPDPLERAFLAGRHTPPEKVDDPEPRLFAAGVPAATGQRPRAKDASSLLLRKASLLDCIASHPTLEQATRAAKEIFNGDEAEVLRFFTRYLAAEEQDDEDLAFEFLSKKGPMARLSPEEQSFLGDLEWLRGVFQTLEGVSLPRSREIAEARFRQHFGRPPHAPPPALKKELGDVRRKRRRREKEEAQSFRRQLGNPDLGAALSQLSPGKQGQRIGEYRRAIEKDRSSIRNRLSDTDADVA